MSIGVFIDLNAYRITKFTLQLLQKYLKPFHVIDYHYYNYSKILHGKLKLCGTTCPAISGRRKVLIDVRLACDAVEYATRHEGGNVLLLCSYVDSQPLFDTLHKLGTHITLACAQRPKITADKYIALERGSDNNTNYDTNKDGDISCMQNTSIDTSSHTLSVAFDRALCHDKNNSAGDQQTSPVSTPIDNTGNNGQITRNANFFPIQHPCNEYSTDILSNNDIPCDTQSIMPSITNSTTLLPPQQEQDYDAQLQAIDILLAKLSL